VGKASSFSKERFIGSKASWVQHPTESLRLNPTPEERPSPEQLGRAKAPDGSAKGVKWSKAGCF
jgi:hypothetical protein